MTRQTPPSAGVLGSLSVAVGRLRRNPVLFVGAFVVTVLGGAIALVGFVDPILANAVSLLWIVVWPFLIAGFLGMVVEAKSGRTSLGTFVSAGKSNYVSMLGATLLFSVLLVGIVFVLSLLVFLVFVVGIIAAGISLEGLLAGGVSTIVVAVALLFVMLLPYFLVYVFLQFYDAAIVASDERAISSLGHSVSVVRRNFLGVVGYTIVFLLVQTVGYGPGYAVLFVGGMEFTETGEWVIRSETLFAVGSLLALVLGTIAMAVAFTYHMTFYESIRPDSGDGNASTDAKRPGSDDPVGARQ